jgi:hypothetical protein
MPGSTHGELWGMSVEDALAMIIALDVLRLEMVATADELAELRRAARDVVVEHAAGVVERYRPARNASLRVVRGGKT